MTEGIIPKAGVQLGHFLRAQGREYVVYERSEKAGSIGQIPAAVSLDTAALTPDGRRTPSPRPPLRNDCLLHTLLVFNYNADLGCLLK